MPPGTATATHLFVQVGVIRPREVEQKVKIHHSTDKLVELSNTNISAKLATPNLTLSFVFRQAGQGCWLCSGGAVRFLWGQK